MKEDQGAEIAETEEEREREQEQEQDAPMKQTCGSTNK